MSAITWHSQDEKPERGTDAVVASRFGFLFEQIFVWNGESWIGLHSGKPLLVKEFWWAPEAEIISTLLADLEARHV